MKTRKLRNLEVSAIGMGCMGFSTGYGEIPSEEESIRLIRLSHELGCTLYRKMRRKAPSFSYGDERRKKTLAF